MDQVTQYTEVCMTKSALIVIVIRSGQCMSVSLTHSYRQKVDFICSTDKTGVHRSTHNYDYIAIPDLKIVRNSGLNELMVLQCVHYSAIVLS